MAIDDKGKMDELDLDIKKTSLSGDQAGEMADGDLDKVAGGQKPFRTITCADTCDSYNC